MEEDNFREFNQTNQLSQELVNEEEMIKELEKEKESLLNIHKLKSLSKVQYFKEQKSKISTIDQ